MIQVEFYQGFSIGDEMYYYKNGKVLKGTILEITHFKCEGNDDVTTVRVQPNRKHKKACVVPFAHIFKDKELCKAYAKNPIVKQYEYRKRMTTDKF